MDVWGESWVLKASSKVETIPDEPLLARASVGAARLRSRLDDELKQYKLVDTDGQPFADAALSEREDNRQVGANNFWLAPHFVKRLAHLGWGFGPSISALGLPPRSTTTTRRSRCTRPTRWPPRRSRACRKTLFQELQHAGRLAGTGTAWTSRCAGRSRSSSRTSARSTWTRPAPGRSGGGSKIRWRPGSCRCSSTWRREFNGKQYHVEMLNDQALWDAAPIEPKTPPNPLRNDKEFLPEFPYLAEPHAGY